MDNKDSGRTVSDLLLHMRGIRQAVPVNKTLRESLKKQLAQRMAGIPFEMTEIKNPGAAAQVPLRLGGWRLLAAGGILLAFMAVGFFLFQGADTHLVPGESREMVRLKLETEPLLPAQYGDGKFMIAARGGSLLLFDGQGDQFGLVNPPKGFLFSSPALSPGGKILALVQGKPGGPSEIVTAGLDDGTSRENFYQSLDGAVNNLTVQASYGQGKEISRLAWSPGGNLLAYTVKDLNSHQQKKYPDKTTLYLLELGKEPRSIGEGSNFSWSPDGAMLVVERDSGYSGQKNLWLVDAKGPGEAVLLGRGDMPAWGLGGYLAYVDTRTRERVLTYLPDGSPQFTVQRLVGEVKMVNLGSTGQRARENAAAGSVFARGEIILPLEFAPNSVETDWVRGLELKGVREPRTLILGGILEIEGITFSPDGKSLLLSRRENGTVALTRIYLTEQLVKREGGSNE